MRVYLGCTIEGIKYQGLEGMKKLSELLNVTLSRFPEINHKDGRIFYNENGIIIKADMNSPSHLDYAKRQLRRIKSYIKPESEAKTHSDLKINLALIGDFAEITLEGSENWKKHILDSVSQTVSKG
jgi:hypothetical protein